MSKKHLNKFDIGQFLDFFYIKSYYSIGRVLKNVNVLQVATGKNPATSIYWYKKKVNIFSNQKNIKIILKKTCF